MDRCGDKAHGRFQEDYTYIRKMELNSVSYESRRVY